RIRNDASPALHPAQEAARPPGMNVDVAGALVGETAREQRREPVSRGGVVEVIQHAVVAVVRAEADELDRPDGGRDLILALEAFAAYTTEKHRARRPVMALRLIDIVGAEHRVVALAGLSQAVAAEITGVGGRGKSPHRIVEVVDAGI